MRAHLATLVLLLSAVTGWADDKKAPSLPRGTPEAQGIASSAILGFVDEAEKKIDALHSFIIVRHGNVVAEGWWTPYDAKTRHELYSLSKSFTSTAVGLAIAEGKLSIDDPVLKFFKDEAPATPSNNLKSMRVHDLLRMSTGHQAEPPMLSSPSAKAFLAATVPFKPGTHFLYNTPATYMCSAIVQKVTGQTVFDYLRPRLFEPLGIEDPTWGMSKEGVSLGGYGLSVRTEDIAKFGQLYLQKGNWQGKQLVPATWVAAATARQTSNGSNPASDWDQGYGYQFWRSRHGAFRGDGAFGQFCLVLPEQDAVIAMTSGTRDLQGVLNIVWDKLLPAMSSSAVAADDAGDSKLKKRLAGLRLPPQKGSATARVPNDAAGKIFKFKENDQKVDALGLEFGAVGSPVTLVSRCNGRSEQRVVCDSDAWKKCRLAFGAFPEQPAAVSGAWTADNTYTAKICFFETPFIIAARLEFANGKLKYDSTSNVGFGQAKREQLVGEPQ